MSFQSSGGPPGSQPPGSQTQPGGPPGSQESVRQLRMRTDIFELVFKQSTQIFTTLAF